MRTLGNTLGFILMLASISAGALAVIKTGQLMDQATQVMEDRP